MGHYSEIHERQRLQHEAKLRVKIVDKIERLSGEELELANEVVTNIKEYVVLAGYIRRIFKSIFPFQPGGRI